MYIAWYSIRKGDNKRFNRREEEIGRGYETYDLN
jgi:hypothetical protein